jgi:hypothetical protein
MAFKGLITMISLNMVIITQENAFVNVVIWWMLVEKVVKQNMCDFIANDLLSIKTFS